MSEAKQELTPVHTLDMLRMYFGIHPLTGKWFVTTQTLAGKDRLRTEHDTYGEAMKRLWDHLWHHAQKMEIKPAHTGDIGDRLVDVEADLSLIGRDGA